MMKTEERVVAYQATSYRVFLPGGAIDLRVGVADAALARWLATEGVSSWAILTAHNPASACLSAVENVERQSLLECALLEEGFLPYAGENIADDGVWPTEESCFVTDISVKNSMAMARRFGQNAFIAGEGEGMPRLVWLEMEKDQEKDQ